AQGCRKRLRLRAGERKQRHAHTVGSLLQGRLGDSRVAGCEKATTQTHATRVRTADGVSGYVQDSGERYVGVQAIGKQRDRSDDAGSRSRDDATILRYPRHVKTATVIGGNLTTEYNDDPSSC